MIMSSTLREKIANTRRRVNDSALGVFINWSPLGVLVEEASLILHEKMLGERSLKQRELYSEWSHCWRRTDYEPGREVYFKRTPLRQAYDTAVFLSSSP